MIKLILQCKNARRKLGNKIFPVALLFSLTLFLSVLISASTIPNVWFIQPGAASALSTKPFSSKVSEVATTTNKPPTIPQDKFVTKVPACNPVHTPLLSPASPFGLSTGIHKQTLKPHYYNVYGNSIDEIIDQIYQCGPLGGGKRYGAITTYDISWKFSYAPKPDDQHICSLNNIVVTQATQISMPSWQADENATAQLKSRWQNLYSTLLDHENGHVKITSDASTNIYNKLGAMPYTACSDIGKKANDLVYAEISKLRDNHVNYDEATNHGSQSIH